MMQSFVKVGTRKMKRGNEAGDDTEERSDGKRECKCCGVEGDGVKAGEPGRAEEDQSAHADKSDTHPNDCAEEGQRQALGNELAENAAPRCSQRFAHREFSAALRAAGEHEVGHVDAGDCQHQG